MRRYSRMMIWLMAVLLPCGMLLGGHTGPSAQRTDEVLESGICSGIISIPLVVYDQAQLRVRSGGELSLSGWVVMPVMGFQRIASTGYSVRTFYHSYNPLESTLVSLDCQLQI